MRSPEQWETLWLRDYRRFPIKVMPDKIKTFVKDIQSDAIQSEREACLSDVKTHGKFDSIIKKICDAIRSRNEKERE